MKLKTTLIGKDQDGNQFKIQLTTVTVQMTRHESIRQHRREINKAHEAIRSIGYDASEILIK